MPYLTQFLDIDRCPHCSIDQPNLQNLTTAFETISDEKKEKRVWRFYKCVRCGGVVTASSDEDGQSVYEIYPRAEALDENIPDEAKLLLKQAIESVFAPSGSIMLCARAIRAMLKEKDYKVGTLYNRLKLATEDGLLMREMEIWAHQIRLDIDDEMYADEDVKLSTTRDARQCIEFTKTFADLLFVIPSKVKRGIEASNQS